MKTIKKLNSKVKYYVGLAAYLIMALTCYSFGLSFLMMAFLFLAVMSLIMILTEPSYNYSVVDSEDGEHIKSFKTEKEAIEFADDCNKDVNVVNLMIKQ